MTWDETVPRSTGAGYRGRFAPTPSGPLHLGSLLTAVAGWLQARRCGGKWLLRIDDLDAQRSRPAAADIILRQLESHGLWWDEAPRWQSRHRDEYQTALEQLSLRAPVYPCVCTRAALARDSRAGPDGPIYRGTCRDRNSMTAERAARRLRIQDGELLLQDLFLGTVGRNLQSEIGDFVVRRADGVAGYQLASVVDDLAMGITDIIRGRDLVASSCRQWYLRKILDVPQPGHGHLPILLDRAGQKLSKQNHAAPLQSSQASANLLRCLGYLNQSPPAELAGAPPAAVLAWAQQHWMPQRVGSAAGLAVED
jgi:glutamyl-Q tRNA(Asp) synthetase